MILYFSGTGNSRFIAQHLARLCGDELVSMNRQLRNRKLDPYNAQYAFSSDSPFVIVCPTYCWHIPRVVEQFLLESRFMGSQSMYFLLTCGSGTGQAAAHAQQICKSLSMRFMGASSILMPENYITLFRAPDVDDAVGIVRASIPQVEAIAQAVQSGRMLKDSNAGPAIPDFICRLFYRFFIHDRLFTAGDACTGCATCAKLCPVANIRIKDGRPVWLGNCTQCQACIAACPLDAIEFGRRSKGKRRYYLFADGRQKFPIDRASVGVDAARR